MEAAPSVQSFFGEGSPYLAHPLLTAERTSAEIDAIEAIVGSSAGRRILDMGCGFGRHAVEFAARGAEVVGIDPAGVMIDAAQQRAQAAGQTVELRVGAAQDLIDIDHYDVAVSLFTSLGQLPASPRADDSSDDLHLAWLAAAHRALHPGGWLVIEVPERARAVEALIEHEVLGPAGAATTVTRFFDTTQSVIVERFATPRDETFQLAYRVFGHDELLALIVESGFEIVRVLDDALTPPPLTFMTVFARRPA